MTKLANLAHNVIANSIQIYTVLRGSGQNYAQEVTPILAIVLFAVRGAAPKQIPFGVTEAHTSFNQYLE